MEKKITVYVVRAAGEDGKSKVYPTKSTANAAVEILADFGVTAGVFPEKRVVALA